MWLRRVFYGWLIPAAFVLPAWLLVGWIISGTTPWALLWVFVSVPIVFIGELVLTLLVRARGTVRATRAVSWIDAAGFGAWHLLIVALGFFNPDWWWPAFFLTVAVGISLLWLSFWQLWREAKPSGMVMYTSEGMGFIPPPAPRPDQTPHEVIVLTEVRNPDKS